MSTSTGPFVDSSFKPRSMAVLEVLDVPHIADFVIFRCYR